MREDAGRAPRRRGDLHPGRLLRREGRRDRLQVRPQVHRLALPGGLESLTYVDGHRAARPRPRPRSTRPRPTTPGCAIGDRLEDRRRAARPHLPARRPHRARRRLLRRRQHRPADAAGGAADHRQGRPLRPDLGRRRPGRLAGRAAGDGSSGSCPARSGSRPARKTPTAAPNEIRDNLSFLPIVLLVFAGVALFVGAFLIFNTFSITVAQRITRVRDAAHARRLAAPDPHLGGRRGAARSALLGALRRARRRLRSSPRASTSLFEAFGIDLPTTGLVLETADGDRLAAGRRRRHAGLLAGARRCAPPGCRRSPRCSEWRRRRPAAARSRLRWRSSALLGARRPRAGPARALRRRRRRRPRPALLGGGAVAILLGVSLFSPRLVPPLASIAGWPLERLRGLTGRLARENALRNPAAPRPPRRR